MKRQSEPAERSDGKGVGARFIAPAGWGGSPSCPSVYGPTAPPLGRDKSGPYAKIVRSTPGPKSPCSVRTQRVY